MRESEIIENAVRTALVKHVDWPGVKPDTLLGMELRGVHGFGHRSLGWAHFRVNSDPKNVGAVPFVYNYISRKVTFGQGLAD